MNALIGELAGAVTLLAFVPYVVSVLQRKTKPERATWFIWTLVGLTLFLSYHSSGAVDTVWSAASYFIGPLCIAILSIKYGVGGWTTLDIVCFIGAGISFLFWALSDSPVSALVMSIFIDALGLIPTFVKTMKDPKSESRLSWSMSFFGNTANLLLAIGSRTFAIIIFPAYMVINTGSILLLTLRSRFSSK